MEGLQTKLSKGAASSKEGTEQQRQPAVLLQGKLSSRSRLIVVFLFTPVCTLYVMVRLIFDARSILHFVAVSVPYVLTALVAAYVPRGVPHGLPLTSCRQIAALCLVIATSDTKCAYDALHTVDFSPGVRIIRAFVSATFALMVVLIGIDVLQTRALRWWASIRLIITVGSLVRLGVVVVLRQVREFGGPDDRYPPARLTFAPALVFNVACLAFSAFGLTPTARRRLSEWSGFYSVTFTLAELHSLPDAAREALRHGAPSVRSDVSSEASRSSRACFQAKPVRSKSSGGALSIPSASGPSSDCSRRSGRGERATQALGVSCGLEIRHPPAPAFSIHKRGRRITMYPEDFERRNEVEVFGQHLTAARMIVSGDSS